MDQLNYSCPADRPLMKANEPNILVKCLHTVIPLIYASCLDAVEKDVFVNSLDDYKVPLCVRACVRACVHACVYACMCAFVCMCLCMYVHVYVYVCVCVCVYARVYACAVH